MKLLLTLFTLIVLSTTVFGADRYVSPHATGSGNGTFQNPWSIWTALVLPGDAGNPVQPGDVVYLRGGAYNLDTTPNEEGAGSDVVYFELSGTAANPIIVRNYPGERATIQVDYILNMGDGYPGRGYVHWIGNNSGGGALEFMDPKTRKWSYGSWGFPRIATISVIGSGVKIINCVIHDLTTVFFSQEGFNNELYGNLIYYMGNNSTDIPMPGQPFGNTGYLQNLTGTKSYINNIAWGGLRNNVQVFSTNGHTKHITVAGNTIFSPGALYPGNVGINSIVGRGTDENDPTSVAEDITFNDNSLYVPSATKTNAEIVGTFFVNTDIEFRRNYILGGSYGANFGSWNPAVVTDNVIVGDATLMSMAGTIPASGTWDNNQYYKGDANKFRYQGSRDFAGWKAATGLDTNSTYSASRPAGTSVVVRPNIYEQGRANITVFNWNLASTANVNLSTTNLVNGQQYEIRDAQNFFGTPVLSGTYSSSSPTVTLTLPGTGSPVTPVQGANDPVNNGWIVLPTHTNVEFNAFVVLPGSVSGNPPPTVTLTAPTNGATVSGVSTNITSTAAATSPATVSNVKYYLDNVLLSTGGAAPTYSYPWNTTFATNGVHSLKAVTTDSNGLTGESASISVTVNNTGPDTIPPVIALTNIVSNDTVTDQVTLKATATDNIAVSSVQFRLRPGGTGAYLNIGAADTTAPYEVVWDSTARPTGSFEITALATDTSANATNSAAVTVNLYTPVGYSVVANDTLTGTGGVNINVHTSESGHTYSRHGNAIYSTGNILLDTNAARADATTNRALSLLSWVPPTDAYRTKIVLKTVVADGSQIGFTTQTDPTLDRMFFVNYDGTAGEVVLWHRNEGVNTKLDTYAVDFTQTGSTREIILDLSGAQLSVYIQGIRRIYIADRSPYPTNPESPAPKPGDPPLAPDNIRRIGIRSPGTAMSATSGFHIDSLSVSMAAATVPASPTGLYCDRSSNTTVLCTFVDNSNNETGFAIEKSVDNSVWVSAGTNLATNATSFTVITTIGAQQYYRVRAVNGVNESTNSTSALTTTYGRYCYLPVCP